MDAAPGTSRRSGLRTQLSMLPTEPLKEPDGFLQTGGGTDLWRDTPVRFGGYANELGESFRPLISRNLVWATYGAAMVYVGCDTLDKGKKASQVRLISAPLRTTQRIQLHRLLACFRGMYRVAGPW